MRESESHFSLFFFLPSSSAVAAERCLRFLDAAYQLNRVPPSLCFSLSHTLFFLLIPNKLLSVSMTFWADVSRESRAAAAN